MTLRIFRKTKRGTMNALEGNIAPLSTHAPELCKGKSSLLIMENSIDFQIEKCVSTSRFYAQ